MTDNEITEIVGWPTEPEMVKYRKIAAAACTVPADVMAAAERMATHLHESRAHSQTETGRQDDRCSALILDFLQTLGLPKEIDAEE